MDESSSQKNTLNCLEKNTVILARGWPSSGKSFAVKQIVDNFNGESVVCSADHYFINDQGVYAFDFNLLGKAHAACRDKFVKALEAGIPLIVVDNTHIVYSDLRDYVMWAAIAGYKIKLVEGKAPWRNNVKECFRRNTHGVPQEVIYRMKETYQDNETVARFCLENLGVQVEFS